MRVSSTVGVAVSAALACVVWSLPAHADEVRTLSGPATGSADVFMTYVSCDGFFAPAVAPGSRLNLGPFTAPLGRRSLGLVPAGPGTAAGPSARFESLVGLDSSLSVSSAGGSQGVSYLWTITSRTPPGSAWSGRAVIAAPAGAWAQVSPASLSYEWTLIDLATREPVGVAEPGTPGDFAATHGDGSGFVVTGWGCDGSAFNIDAVRAGGLVYDFEGVALRTTLAMTGEGVRPDGTVEITGTVLDASDRLTGDPLVLESRVSGGEWVSVGEPLLADASGVTHVDTPISETTEFRWHRPESQYADEGWSAASTVTVPVSNP